MVDRRSEINSAGPLTHTSGGHSTERASTRDDASTVRAAHYVFSSHWDREWHEPFEVFRRRLVYFFDTVLDAIAEQKFSGPMYCDGQAVVLEDYLAVRPEREAELRAALASGQIVGGPWYVPPDELLVSGESLVRNLRRGRAGVRRLGAEPSDAGFLGDLFGHNSQMPQIFAGFGIRGGFLWRGVNLPAVRHFRWHGADGSVLPTYRFGTNGYWGFAVHVGGFTSAQPTARVADGLADRLTDYLNDEALATKIGPVLLFDGPDHRQLDNALHGKLFACFDANNRTPDSSFHIKASTLDEYQRAMLDESESIEVQKIGELLEPAFFSNDRDQQWLIAGTLSSRIWIKQANAAGQAWLCHAAEPWSAMIGRVAGESDPSGLLERAWDLLLKNHAHDSICGCSIDAVHEDVAGRFRRSRQIAETLANDAWAKLARRADLPDHPHSRRLLLTNPTPRPRTAVTEATVHIPADWATADRFNFDPQPIAHFDLIDENGQSIAFQRLSQQLNVVHVERLHGRSPRRYRAHRVKIAIEAKLPALGYRTLRVIPLDVNQPMRGRPRRRGMMHDDRSMANGWVRVQFQNNGSFTLTDLATGEIYERQLTFEDTGDVGDGWNYEAPANNAAHNSSASHADLALVEDGPLQTTFRVRVTMTLPRKFDAGSQSRSEDVQPMIIDSFVTLRRGEATVHVRTEIDHEHEDHRLQVLLPTGVATDRYLADSAFDVVERKVGLAEDIDAYREDPVEMRPQQSWTAAHSGRRGLAVVVAGLPECAVLDRADRPIALTLFRATRRTVFTNGEPGGQLRRKLSFRYAIQVLGESPDRAALCELGQRLNLLEDARTIEASPTECGLEGAAPRVPAEGSLIALTGPAVMTSFREIGGAIEARLFNPATQPVTATLTWPEGLAGWTPPTRAVRVDFESQPLGKFFEIKAGVIELGLTPKQVMTVRFEHASNSPDEEDQP